MDFLGQYARKTGKLNKGGEPDIHVVSKMVLNDWLRGKIPYYVAPPDSQDYVKPAPTEKKKKSVPGVQQILSKILVDASFD